MAEEKIQRFYPKAIIVRPSLLVNKTRKLTFVFWVRSFAYSFQLFVRRW